MKNNEKTQGIPFISIADRRETAKLRTFSVLGIKPPKTKKERYRVERLAQKMGKKKETA